MPRQVVTSFPKPDFQSEPWVWDSLSKPPEVELSSTREDAYFYVDPVMQSTGTVAVRGSKGFAEGEHYWEVIFLEPPFGTSVMVGVGTVKAELRSGPYQFVNLIGRDNESWGLSYKGSVWHAGQSRKYCEPFFAQETVIGVHLDLYNGQLTFYKDGVCLGPAYTGLRASRQQRLYPIVSSTATETELGLGVRVCRLAQPSPLQGECLERIKSSLSSLDGVESLPLPRVMKDFLKGM